jgi:hypothetical protein
MRGIYKTATTGVAALNIGGRTIHSWSGIGCIDDRSLDQIITSACANTFVTRRWKRANLLIIDESQSTKRTLTLGPSHMLSFHDGRHFFRHSGQNVSYPLCADNDWCG